MIRKVSAEDIAIRGNGTGLEYMCPTWHFVYIFFNPVFQVSTAKNEINLFNNHILIVAPVTFAPAGAMTPSAEFLYVFTGLVEEYLVKILGWFPLILHKKKHVVYSFRSASNEYPQHVYLWRNKTDYPRMITKYFSLTSPRMYLSHIKNTHKPSQMD